MNFITVLGIHDTLTFAKQRNLSDIRKKKGEQNKTLPLSVDKQQKLYPYTQKTISSKIVNVVSKPILPEGCDSV